MNGYMVLTNGCSQACSSPSLSSRTFSRPAGDIAVNLEAEPPIRKMDTVVRLDAVRIYYLFVFKLQIYLFYIYVSRSQKYYPHILSYAFYLLLYLCCSFLHHPSCINPCAVLRNAQMSDAVVKVDMVSSLFFL